MGPPTWAGSARPSQDGRRRSRRAWLTGVLIAALPALVLLLLIEDRSTLLPRGLALGAPGRPAAPAADNDRGPSSGLLFSGDFETGDLSQWESAQSANPGRIAVVTGPRVQGRYAGRFEVRSGDVAAAGTGSGNRAEVLARRQDGNGAWPDSEGSERYYGWSTYFPSNYPVVRGWQTFVQWKNKGPGSSPLAMGVYNGRIRLQAKTRGGPATKLSKEPLVRGRWQRFVLHVKWSPDPRVGFVELWHNGRKVVRRRYRPTMYRERDGRVLPNYLKQGLYRSSGILRPQIVYHDGMRVGLSFGDVAPEARAPRARR